MSKEVAIDWGWGKDAVNIHCRPREHRVQCKTARIIKEGGKRVVLCEVRHQDSASYQNRV